MNPNRLPLTKDFLEQKYIKENLNSYQIAEIIGCHYGSIQKYLHKFGIPLKKKYIDISGKKFGLLTTIKLSHFDKNNQAVWYCKCDCGKEKFVIYSNLVKANTASCGCLVRRKSYQSISGMKFGIIRKNAKARDLKFDITINQIWDLFIKQNKKCALSGIDIVLDFDLSKTTASLDRIDSSKDYIETNIQWVHKDINRMKWEFDQNYFIGLCNKISDYNRKK